MPTRPVPLVPLLAVAALVIAGCGADMYKSRLNETAQYFGYREKLNQELGPAWQGSGVLIRAPKQFVPISPPAPPPEPEGDEESVNIDDAEDPRQPHYLGIELPGLLGAWEATVIADVGGQDEPRKAYLYMLGNHYRHLQKPDQMESGFVEDPQAYLSDLENLLTGTIGVVLPEGETGTGVEKNRRYRESAPRVEPNTKFTPRKDFTGITLSPQIDVGDLDLPFEMQLYEWAGQQVQLAVLMVYPQSVNPRENLQERLLLALETLDISDNAPAAQAQPGESPGGGEGGGGRQGF